MSKQVLARMVPGLGVTAVSLASVTGSWRQALDVPGHVYTFIRTSWWKVWVASRWWGGMECQKYFSWHLWYQLVQIGKQDRNRYIDVTGLMCDGGHVECNHPHSWSSVHSSNALYWCIWNSSCQGNKRLHSGATQSTAVIQTLGHSSSPADVAWSSHIAASQLP